MTELKPCPFCGSKVETPTPYSGPIGRYVFCPNCHLSVYHGFCRDEDSYNELIKLWNRRVKE